MRCLGTILGILRDDSHRSWMKWNELWSSWGVRGMKVWGAGAGSNIIFPPVDPRLGSANACTLLEW